ncbi:MAG: hypothetical protein WCW30_05015 [Candidatus Gracilibacteria bacterium]
MKRSFFLFGLTLSLLIMSGCLFGSQYYSLSNCEKDPASKVITMKTVDENSDEFTFRMNPGTWDLQIWDEEKAPNRVALVNKTYPEGDCYVLPGTMGQGYQEGWTVTEGVLMTQRGNARTLDIINQVGIRLKYIVGYEIEEMPYIFEINFPVKDQDICSADAQALVSSFNADLPETTQPTDETLTPDPTGADTPPNSDEIVTPTETTVTPTTEDVVQ